MRNSYRTSINIQHDIGKESFVKNYLPTESHAESIIGISDGFINKDDSSAHIMVGPYGSGKSLLATILANFVSGSVDERILEDLILKYSKVHDDTSVKLQELKRSQLDYIPVVLSGNYQSLGSTLINELVKVLEKEKIHIQINVGTKRIESIIQTWKSEFKMTYERFISLLKERQMTLDQWLVLFESDLEEVEWFKEQYHHLTSGADFDEYDEADFNAHILHILDVLREHKKGVFIIHDEFGRLLQNLSRRNIYQTMQVLQDLAEVTDRSEGHLQLLFISHRNMSQYMLGLDQDVQSEFQRIEKRFKTYYVESDSATYYRIVENHIQNNLKGLAKVPKGFEEMKSFLREVDLFPELNQTEIEEVIIKGTYPLHPLTLYMLPKISKVFGQNERTLYSFLFDRGQKGLTSLLESAKGYVYPDAVFDYFLNDFEEAQYLDEDVRNTLQKYKGIKSKLSLRKRNAYRIIKLITLWSLTGINNVLPIDTRLISTGTGLSETKLKPYLEELVDLKIIRFNHILQKWELIEASSVMIDKLINDKRSEVPISLETRINYLEKSLEDGYFLAHDYNDDKNITRFGRVRVLSSRQLLNEGSLSEIEFDSDMKIQLVVLENEEHKQEALDLIKESDDQFLINAFLTKSFKAIIPYIDKEIIIEELLADQKLLLEHDNLSLELEILQEEQIYFIKEYLADFEEFTSNTHWYYLGEKIQLTNKIQLENLLSKVMYDNYPKTPVFMNDLVNRKHVKGIQERSLLKVIDHVIESPREDNIGITDQGPHYLIYATIIKNKGVQFNRLDDIEDDHLKELRSSLLTHLTHYPTGKLNELISILTQPPFGIRRALVPLVFITLIRDVWDQLMFSRNEMFVPALDAVRLTEMVYAAEEYEYKFYNFSNDMTDFMNAILDEYEAYTSEYVLEDTVLVKVSSTLLNFLRSLPRRTQTTRNQEKIYLDLKDTIRQLEFSPLSGIEKVFSLVKGNFNQLKSLFDDFQKEHKLFVNQLEVNILKKLDINRFGDEINSNYSSRLVAKYNDSVDLQSFLESYIGTPVEFWSDINESLFYEQLEQDTKESTQTDLSAEDDYLIRKIKETKEVNLSKKSEIIYKNVERILKQAGRTVSKDELNTVLKKIFLNLVN